MGDSSVVPGLRAASSAGGPPLRWAVTRTGGITTAWLCGELDGAADLAALAPELVGRVVLDLQDVHRVRAAGVRDRMHFLRRLVRVTDLSVARCSPAVVNQINLNYGFLGAARVRSFRAPYVCAACGIEELRLLDVERDFPPRDGRPVPAFTCPRCGGTLELDELPERYLSFLRDR